MKGAGHILTFSDNRDRVQEVITAAHLIFILDYNDLKRVEEMGEIIQDAPAVKVMIDHHPDPAPCADIILSDVGYASTAEMVYMLLKKMEFVDLIDKNIGESLYCGMMTDTGSFKFSGTTARTHRIVAVLFNLGIQHTEVHQRIFDSSTEDKLRLTGYALYEGLKFIPEYKTAYIKLDENILKQFNYKKGDTEGLVNYALSVDGVNLAAIFTEKEPQIVRISFRSKGKLAVNTMAKKHFEGGGHINAAGGIFKGSIDDAIAKFEKLLPDWIKK
jgi:phosphoesterase RecJ-like protein